MNITWNKIKTICIIILQTKFKTVSELLVMKKWLIFLKIQFYLLREN